MRKRKLRIGKKAANNHVFPFLSYCRLFATKQQCDFKIHIQDRLAAHRDPEGDRPVVRLLLPGGLLRPGRVLRRALPHQGGGGRGEGEEGEEGGGHREVGQVKID